mmetsp:Transcript_84892/g.235415  ORF Transcript_84892/g.235415 Transcript_84892/m.235415 type:complete len:351 (-) Transcript_84892:264-1316(-)
MVNGDELARNMRLTGFGLVGLFEEEHVDHLRVEACTGQRLLPAASCRLPESKRPLEGLLPLSARLREGPAAPGLCRQQRGPLLCPDGSQGLPLLGPCSPQCLLFSRFGLSPSLPGDNITIILKGVRREAGCRALLPRLPILGIIERLEHAAFALETCKQVGAKRIVVRLRSVHDTPVQRKQARRGIHLGLQRALLRGRASFAVLLPPVPLLRTPCRLRRLRHLSLCSLCCLLLASLGSSRRPPFSPGWPSGGIRFSVFCGNGLLEGRHDALPCLLAPHPRIIPRLLLLPHNSASVVEELASTEAAESGGDKPHPALAVLREGGLGAQAREPPARSKRCLLKGRPGLRRTV